MRATPCQGGCGTLVTKPGKCRACLRASDRHRLSATERGYTAQWAKEAKLFLRAHPICQCPDCQDGKGPHPLPSQVVDHRIPHKGDMRLFWDPSNWQAMNKTCHDRKTATEDGGFGRTPSPRPPAPGNASPDQATHTPMGEGG